MGARLQCFEESNRKKGSEFSGIKNRFSVCLGEGSRRKMSPQPEGPREEVFKIEAIRHL